MIAFNWYSWLISFTRLRGRRATLKRQSFLPDFDGTKVFHAVAAVTSLESCQDGGYPRCIQTDPLAAPARHTCSPPHFSFRNGLEMHVVLFAICGTSTLFSSIWAGFFFS
jgi:hypothetical protein